MIAEALFTILVVDGPRTKSFCIFSSVQGPQFAKQELSPGTSRQTSQEITPYEEKQIPKMPR